MVELIATVEQAAGWVSRSSTPREDWNPVYRAMAPPPGEPAAPRPAGSAAELLHDQLTAPALMVLAVTEGASTSRVRIAVRPMGAGVEFSDADAPSRWSRAPIREVPAVCLELLGTDVRASAPPRLTIESEADGLGLTPEQHAAARAALADGAGAETAYATVPGLDERLRDALTASGPRVSLSLTLHDPGRAVAEKPVSFSRLWVTGHHGLYRADAPGAPGVGDGAIHAVRAGDVLGTVLPLLEEGMRFSAACAAAEGAR